jgi:uncharacterized protein YggE
VRAVIALAVVLSAPAAAAAQTPDSASTVPTIVTSGDATVTRPPDVAYLTVAVETHARSPRDAQKQNADAMSGVQKQLADAGVPKDALRTLGLWLEQEFDVNNGRRTPRGFVARNTLEVRIDEVSRAGELADAVVQGGATSLNGIRFDLKDRAAAERDALRLAVAEARRRADAAAAGVGRTVDRVIKIEDSRAEVVSPRLFAARAEAVGQASTAVEPGLIEIRAHASLTATMK